MRLDQSHSTFCVVIDYIKSLTLAFIDWKVGSNGQRAESVDRKALACSSPWVVRRPNSFKELLLAYASSVVWWSKDLLSSRWVSKVFTLAALMFTLFSHQIKQVAQGVRWLKIPMKYQRRQLNASTAFFLWRHGLSIQKLCRKLQIIEWWQRYLLAIGRLLSLLLLSNGRLSTAKILGSLSVRQDFDNKLEGSYFSILERAWPLDLSSKSFHLFVRFQMVILNRP